MAPSSDIEVLYKELRRRLIESGEWEHIQADLGGKLSESGWADDLRNRTKEKARTMNPLSFQLLLEEMTAHAQTTIPHAVKREYTSIIKRALEKHLE